MLRWIQTVFFILMLRLIFAQSGGQRGAVITNTEPPKTGKTYALIIGISKYAEVQSLKYADRDAEAFAAFLKSKAGGSVPDDNIKMFTNEDATRANIFDEMYYLKSVIQPGDALYFYFAGHGDIEQDLSEGEDALLLLYKSFKKNYLIGSEFIELDKLGGYISNFAKKGVNVVFIADACHSGALLSGGTDGRERTLHALEKSWGNEVKFLSCQPNEVSEENIKWGGGRGIFSYTLEDGLKGLADTNGDSVVSVGEIKRYLESQVAEQTGDAQNPEVTGDPKRKIASVDMNVLLALREEKQRELPQMVAMNTGRSAVDNLLANASPHVKDLYHDFNEALTDGKLLHPESGSAMDIFEKIDTSDAPAELKRIARRNFVSALQDGAMLFIQNQLTGSKNVDDYNQKLVNDQLNKWNTAIENLGAAIKLLGPDHYLTPYYKARQLYLEAYVLYFKMNNHTRDYTVANRDSCIQKLEDAVKLEENASYAYYMLGEVYSFIGRRELAAQNYQKYLKLNPKDGFAFINLAYLAHQENNDPLADSLIVVGVATGSNNPAQLMDYVAGYYYNYNKYDSAIVYYKKAIAINPKIMGPYLNLGVIAKRQKDYLDAEKYYKKVLELDSTYSWAYNNLANVYSALGQSDQAIKNYNLAIRYDSTYDVAITNLAIQYENQKDYDQAFKLYHLAKSVEPYSFNAYYGIGNIHYNREEYDSAIMYYYYCTQLDTGDAKSFYYLGRSYDKKGDTTDAIYYYSKSILHDTTYALPWNQIGNYYYDKKEYNKAINFYSRAVVLDTTSVAYWNNLGKAYQYMDSVGVAEQIFRFKSLKLDSASTTAYIQLGNLFYDSRKYDSAWAYYQKAIHFDSAETSALFNLALITDIRFAYDSSIFYYKQVLHFDSAYPGINESLAEAYYNLKQYDSSRYYSLRQLNTDTAFQQKTLYRMGYIAYLNKDSIEALDYFNKILARSQDVMTKYMVAAIYQDGGNFPEAKKWYQSIENDTVFRPYVLSQYGAMEEVDSNYQQALEDYQQAIRWDSSNVYNWNRAGYVLGRYLNKPEEGKTYIEQALAIDTANKNSSYSYMASNYFLSGDTATSLKWYFTALDKNPDDNQAIYNIACIYSLTGKFEDALSYLEKSLEKGYNDFQHISEDTDLDNLRELKDFKALIEKYKAKSSKKG